MKRGALTLVETLVVLGVIGILLSLAMPAIQKLRGLSDRIACQSQMRQIMVAMHHHHNDYHTLPPRSAETGKPESRMSWQAHLLPYLEQGSLYRAALTDFVTYPRPEQLPLHQGQNAVIKAYVCPGDTRLLAVQEDHYGDLGAFTSYVAAADSLNTTTRKRHSGALAHRLEDIHDGAANTIAFGERPPPDGFLAGWWYSGAIAFGGKPLRGPNQFLFLTGTRFSTESWPDCALTPYTFGPGRLSNPCDRFHFWSLHTGGANFAFVDGSVRFLGYHVGSDFIAALISVNGGEAITLPD